MDRKEKIEALLADVEPRLEALRDEAMEEIRGAREEADANVRRHEEAASGLAGVEAEISRLNAEREELPNRAYRAGLDEDYEREDDLKERYRELKPEIEALEARRDALSDELSRLDPRGGGHPKDVVIEHLGDVAGVAHGARADLEELKDALTRALDRAVGPVARAHDGTRATVEQLGRDRAWAESPVGRGGLRV